MGLARSYIWFDLLLSRPPPPTVRKTPTTTARYEMKYIEEHSDLRRGQRILQVRYFHTHTHRLLLLLLPVVAGGGVGVGGLPSVYEVFDL